MPLPAPLLLAATDATQRFALILGAGSSFEAPTSIPLSRELSANAHQRLVDHHVLELGECEDPTDLAKVADLVVAKTGSQQALVERLDPVRLRTPTPNVGHLLAAALLREQCISDVLTLNFDVSLNHALGAVGNAEVHVIERPDDCGQLGQRNVIYLHGSANLPFPAWFVTTAAMANAWQNQWQGALAGSVLTAPVLVFAGLGSPAPILEATINRIWSEIGEHQQCYFVDPVPRASSGLYNRMARPKDGYVELSWCSFMRELADAVVKGQLQRLAQMCSAIVAARGMTALDLSRVIAAIAAVGLIALGELRANWLRKNRAYLPESQSQNELIADLFLGIALIEQLTQSTCRLENRSEFSFWRDATLIGTLQVASGCGVMDALLVQTQLTREGSAYGAQKFRSVLVAHVIGSVEDETVPLPMDVADAEARVPDDIVSPEEKPALLSLEKLRGQPNAISVWRFRA